MFFENSTINIYISNKYSKTLLTTTVLIAENIKWLFDIKNILLLNIKIKAIKNKIKSSKMRAIKDIFCFIVKINFNIYIVAKQLNENCTNELIYKETEVLFSKPISKTTIRKVTRLNVKATACVALSSHFLNSLKKYFILKKTFLKPIFILY